MDLTLSYKELKESIRNDLNSVAERFVAIGYQLKQVRDGELFKEDGYKDICEFAKKEYNIGKSNTYYFMKINDRFSVDGNSRQLIPEYEGYGSSKLTEMLNLDEEELKLVSERTTRDEIRVINQVKKEAENEPFQPAGKIDESLDFTQSKSDFVDTKKEDLEVLKNVVFEYFNDKNKREQLREISRIFRKEIFDLGREVAIVINPSGHSMFRKGTTVTFLEEKVIKVKPLGKGTMEFTYIDFLHATEEIFDLAAEDPWREKFGEPEPEIKEPEKKETIKKEPEKKEPVKKEQPKKVETKTEEKAEIEKSPESNNIPGQIEVEDFPEYMPDTPEKVEGEVILEESQEDIINEDKEESEESDSTEEEAEENNPKAHDLKTDHIYFSDVLTNKKRFELRLNDRDYKVGDILRLHEQINGQETGRTAVRLITYMLENYTGLVDKYCILGIEPVGEEIWKETK
ncbi:DUF3850 domain-containing protein [Anaerocolumna chitinilytica]|uniref:DUF3850 domain-containing protein n=1 Tax=Anaerocolumna chitinilytica TaxID=1727145 RepID=A0A7M3SA13_9FIRM|nr:DUF3850 domain-containing protein [Anaerocolumna chitinilytica]BCK01431.1 hypothetical protein bsdcttw_44710 [Anaerocolumna chitinilytica]